MKSWITIIGLIAIVGFFTWILNMGGNKQFVVDCETWQRYEREYVLFELEANLTALCELEGVQIK